MYWFLIRDTPLVKFACINQCAPVWIRIGSGLAPDWIRIGSGLDPDWLRIGSGLDPDWLRIGSGLAPDWLRIGSGLDPHRNLERPQNVISCSLFEGTHLVKISCKSTLFK